jgi:hypothetical protein
MSDPSLLILASLAEGDKHEYAMMTDIRTFANVELGPGTLYGPSRDSKSVGSFDLWAAPIGDNPIV